LGRKKIAKIFRLHKIEYNKCIEYSSGMSLKKRIGISLRIQLIEKYDEKRDTISHDWINFLQKVNCIPILIPNNLTDMEDYISEMKLDGIILSGGDNIGEFPERDQTEKKILEFAIKNSFPVLGICRGMQVVNKFFEGDVTKNENSDHVGKSHYVNIINAKFENHLGDKKFQVNSFHNNLIKNQNLGHGLEIFALSDLDQTIEGYFHKKYPIIGVMWHPERKQQTVHQSRLIDIFYNKTIW
jgi:putative glutamine amidotransferase